MRRLLHRTIVTVAAGPLHTFACWLFGVADRIWWDEGEPVDDETDMSEADLRKAWAAGVPVDVAKTPLAAGGYTTNAAVGSHYWTISGPYTPVEDD